MSRNIRIPSMRLRVNTRWCSVGSSSARYHRCQQQAVRPFSKSSHDYVPLRVPLDIPPPFPLSKTCPEPSCSCPPTPPMPDQLPIDHEQVLNGTMAPYTQHILVCTGKDDWTSRIENDGEGEGWGGLVRGLKHLLGRGGKYADVCCCCLELFTPGGMFCCDC